MFDLFSQVHRSRNVLNGRQVLRRNWRPLPTVELLEPRELLSLAGSIGLSVKAHKKTPVAVAVLHRRLNGTHTFAPDHSVRLDARNLKTALRSTNHTRSKIDAGDALVSVTFGGQGFRAITSDVRPGFP